MLVGIQVFSERLERLQRFRCPGVDRWIVDGDNAGVVFDVVFDHYFSFPAKAGANLCRKIGPAPARGEVVL